MDVVNHKASNATFPKLLDIVVVVALAASFFADRAPVRGAGLFERRTMNQRKHVRALDRETRQSTVRVMVHEHVQSARTEEMNKLLRRAPATLTLLWSSDLQ